MKSRACYLLTALAFALLPSCVSSGLATAAVVGSGVASIPGVSKLLGKDAPTAAELIGHSFDYSGEYRGAANVAEPRTGSILFGGTNPSVAYLADGTTRTTCYTRQDSKKATITIITAAGEESFRLSFTDAKNGSYVYEKRHGENFATGEGQFILK